MSTGKGALGGEGGKDAGGEGALKAAFVSGPRCCGVSAANVTVDVREGVLSKGATARHVPSTVKMLSVSSAFAVVELVGTILAIGSGEMDGMA